MPRVVEAIVRAKEPTVVDLTLARPATVFGICWDPDDETAFEGVDVELRTMQGTLVRAALTDPQGHYRFESLKPGPYILNIKPPIGFVTKELARTIDLAPHQDLEMDFELRPGGIVKGRLLDEHTGEPLPNMDIALLDMSGREIRRARTTSDGSYEFVNLPEDRYSVVVADGSGA